MRWWPVDALPDPPAGPRRAGRARAGADSLRPDRVPRRRTHPRPRPRAAPRPRAPPRGRPGPRPATPRAPGRPARPPRPAARDPPPTLVSMGGGEVARRRARGRAAGSRAGRPARPPRPPRGRGGAGAPGRLPLPRLRARRLRGSAGPRRLPSGRGPGADAFAPLPGASGPGPPGLPPRRHGRRLRPPRARQRGRRRGPPAPRPRRVPARGPGGVSASQSTSSPRHRGRRPSRAAADQPSR